MISLVFRFFFTHVSFPSAGESARFTCATDIGVSGLSATWLRDNKPLDDKLADRIKTLGPPEDLASLAKGGMGMGSDPAANLMAIANPNLPQEFREAATEFTGAHMKVMIAFAGTLDLGKMIPN